MTLDTPSPDTPSDQPADHPPAAPRGELAQLAAVAPAQQRQIRRPDRDRRPGGLSKRRRRAGVVVVAVGREDADDHDDDRERRLAGGDDVGRAAR